MLLTGRLPAEETQQIIPAHDQISAGDGVGRCDCAGVGGAAGGAAAGVRRRHPWRDGLRRQRQPRAARRRRHSRRPHRGGRRPRRGARGNVDRRHEPGGRAGIHQHAVVVDRVAARRRPLAGRDSPGRDDADLRRGLVDGAAQRRDEAADDRADGRPEVRDHLDHAGRVSRGGRTPRRLAERRVVPRRDDRARACDRTRRPEADGRRARRDAGHRAPRDGGRRARHRLVADLRAGVLCHAPRS